MHKVASPECVVQRQFEAYNAKNIGAWPATYAGDAKQFVLVGELLASGHAEINVCTWRRFSERDLHAKLL